MSGQLFAAGRLPKLVRVSLTPARRPPFRPALSNLRALTSATLSPDESEHLEPKAPRTPNAQTGYIYFDSLYPIKLGFWDIRSLFVRTDHKVLLERLKHRLPDSGQVGHGFEVIGAEER